MNAIQTVSKTDKILQPVSIQRSVSEAWKHVLKIIALEKVIDQILAVVGSHVVGNIGAFFEENAAEAVEVRVKGGFEGLHNAVCDDGGILIKLLFSCSDSFRPWNCTVFICMSDETFNNVSGGRFLFTGEK